MALVKEMYSGSRINLIYQLLKNEVENGTPKEYDVKVDELKVVSRNNDPERFHSHEEFVLPESRNITINIYDSKSHRCTRYMLLLKEEEPSKQELSGIEKTISTKMSFEKSKWEHDQLKKDYAALQEKHSEAEEYIETLKTECERMKEEFDKVKASSNITDKVINLAGIYLSANPKALNGIPFLSGLLGTPEKTAEQTPTENSAPAPEGECTFTEHKAEPLQYTGKITQEDSKRFSRALVPLFPAKYVEKVFMINKLMTGNHELIDEIADLLEDNNSPEEKAPKAA